MSDFNVNSSKGGKTTWPISLGGCGCLMLIGLVIALVLPAVFSAKQSARRMQCSNQLKEITLALHAYHDVYKSLPPAYTTDADGKPLHSWRVLILPFIEEQRLYDQIRLDESWDSEHNRQFHNQIPRVYLCPTANSDAWVKGATSYMRLMGPGTTTNGPDTVTLKEVTAGKNSVFWLVEVIPTTCWMEPVDVRVNELAGDFQFSRESGVGSMHKGGLYHNDRGTNICYLNGSVCFMPDHAAYQLKDLGRIKKQ